jgi:hypothetical protein
MKSFSSFIVGIISVSLLFSSCGKKNNVGSRIPKNALFVTYVNMNSMATHLSWDEIKQTDWFKKVYDNKETEGWRKKILDNPDSSGIDFKKGLIFFSQRISEDNYFFVAEGTIKDQKDFEQLNRNIDPSQPIKKQGDVNLLTLKDKSVLGWKDDHFAYVMNAKTPNPDIYTINDSTNSKLNSPVVNEQLVAYCSKLFNLKSDSSLEKNEIFGGLLSLKGDIQVWQNTEEIVKSNPAKNMLGMLKLDAFLKDNFTTYSINFEDGKIETFVKNHFSKELTDILKKYVQGKINTDLINNIPSQNIDAIFAANFKPQGIVEMIKLTGADGLINSYIQQLGFSLDDFSKAGNGDLLVAISDLKLKTDSAEMQNDIANKQKIDINFKPEFNYVFAAGISDKASLEKLVAAGLKLKQLTENKLPLSHDMNDKIFVISNTDSFAKLYLAGAKNKFDLINKIQGHPVAVYIDLQKILTTIANGNGFKSDSALVFQQNLKTWKDFYITGGEYENDAFNSTAELNFMNNDVNSLKQLNTFINEIFKIHESQRSNDHIKNLDSLLTPPPIDTVKFK